MSCWPLDFHHRHLSCYMYPIFSLLAHCIAHLLFCSCSTMNFLFFSSSLVSIELMHMHVWSLSFSFFPDFLVKPGNIKAWTKRDSSFHHFIIKTGEWLTWMNSREEKMFLWEIQLETRLPLIFTASSSSSWEKRWWLRWCRSILDVCSCFCSHTKEESYTSGPSFEKPEKSKRRWDGFVKPLNETWWWWEE